MIWKFIMIFYNYEKIFFGCSLEIECSKVALNKKRKTIYRKSYNNRLEKDNTMKSSFNRFNIKADQKIESHSEKHFPSERKFLMRQKSLAVPIKTKASRFWTKTAKKTFTKRADTKRKPNILDRFNELCNSWLRHKKLWVLAIFTFSSICVHFLWRVPFPNIQNIKFKIPMRADEKSMHCRNMPFMYTERTRATYLQIFRFSYADHCRIKI